MNLSVSVCPLAYLKNNTAELHEFLCMLPVAVTQSCADGVAIRYELSVLWMTSVFTQWALGSMGL